MRMWLFVPLAYGVLGVGLMAALADHIDEFAQSKRETRYTAVAIALFWPLVLIIFAAIRVWVLATRRKS